MQQERALVRRFGVLTALGFMPLGLLVPTYVLLLTARGFGPTAIGALIAATAVVTLVLELPTGGLADVIGRRVVLIASSLVMAVGFVLFGLVQQGLRQVKEQQAEAAQQQIETTKRFFRRGGMPSSC